MYSFLLAIIYFAFISLGLPDSLVGSGWPVMHQDLGVPESYAGMLTMIIACGTIISSLLSDRLTRLLGTGLVTAISVGMTALALFAFSVSGSFWLLCIWAVPYGLGAGAVDAALNNYVALHYASRHMNWLHSFWGVGASISPFIMSSALSSGLGWHGGYRIVGIIQISLTVLLFITLPLWKKVHPTDKKDDVAEAADVSTKPLGLFGALRIPGVSLVLIAFLAYCAWESTAILWSSTYLVGSRGIDEVTAAAFASLYVLGITAGRFLSGFISDRLGDKKMIRLGMFFSAVGVVMIMLPLDTELLALAGLVITGLGSAPIYPAIIHSTPTNFGAANSHAIIGIQMAAAYTGTTLMPPLFGVLSSWIGMWLFPFYMIVFVLLAALMTERLNGMIAGRDA